MTFNCVIVDDEYLARQYLRDYISKVPYLHLVGDYDSPLLLHKELKIDDIDILFLDIQINIIQTLEIINLQLQILSLEFVIISLEFTT